MSGRECGPGQVLCLSLPELWNLNQNSVLAEKERGEVRNEPGPPVEQLLFGRDAFLITLCIQDTEGVRGEGGEGSGRVICFLYIFL